MLITLSRPTDISQLVAKVYLTSAIPLGGVSHRPNFLKMFHKHTTRFQFLKQYTFVGISPLSKLLLHTRFGN